MSRNSGSPGNRPPVMVSACLLGVHCRYDGLHALCPDLRDFAGRHPCIPFCPEQLGGLPTPRSPCRIVGGDGRDVLTGKARLINADGENRTEEFRRGAEEAYRLSRLMGSGIAVMKSGSPSCGIHTVYCEKPEGRGTGVTAALFQKRGIIVFELDSNDSFPDQKFLDALKQLNDKERPCSV